MRRSTASSFRMGRPVGGAAGCTMNPAHRRFPTVHSQTTPPDRMAAAGCTTGWPHPPSATVHFSTIAARPAVAAGCSIWTVPPLPSRIASFRDYYQICCGANTNYFGGWLAETSVDYCNPEIIVFPQTNHAEVIAVLTAGSP